MGIKSRKKLEKRSFKSQLVAYEKQYFSHVRNLLNNIDISSLPINLKPTRSIIHQCSDCFVVIRLPRESLPDKFEVIDSRHITGSEIINKYKFKSSDGDINNIKVLPGDLKNQRITLCMPYCKENGKTYHPDYHSVLVFGELIIDDPADRAKNDFNFFIIGSSLEINIRNYGNYKPTIIESLERYKCSFKTILDKETREEDIQKFIDDHPIILDPISNRHIPKMKIGKYITDFVFVKSDQCKLVELERSSHKLFTKKSDFTSPVNHGWQQLEDWDRELEKEKVNIESKYSVSNIENRCFSLVIGRSKNLSIELIQKIRTRSRQSRRYEILTYDDVLDNFTSLIEGLKRYAV